MRHPIYPELFRGEVTEYIDKPCTDETGRKLWQACYICGRSIVFDKEAGKWQAIGDNLIRHKDCDPPPIKLGVL